MTNNGKDAVVGDVVIKVDGKKAQEDAVMQYHSRPSFGNRRKLWIGALFLVFFCLIAALVALAITKSLRNRGNVRNVSATHTGANTS